MSSELYWNRVFARLQGEGIQSTTSWLERYHMYLQTRRVEKVLEIGFGSGNDTRYLVDHRFQVTATDFSEVALELVRSKIPDAILLQHDTRHPFPFTDKSFDLVVASLSLHYFNQSQMKRIIEEIKRVLKNNSLLLIRLNSIHDADATEEHSIERYFYKMESCRILFSEWKELSLQEVTEDYYGKMKVMIEGMFEKQHVNLTRG